jgi:hypothetical protein
MRILLWGGYRAVGYETASKPGLGAEVASLAPGSPGRFALHPGELCEGDGARRR